MRNNNRTIKCGNEKKNNKLNKMTKLHSIYLEFKLQYTLTSYYIVKDTFGREVMTVQ